MKALFTLRRPDVKALNELQPQETRKLGDVVECDVEPYNDSGHMTVSIALKDREPYTINGVRKAKAPKVGFWHEAQS